MTVRLSIEGASAVGPGIWRASIKPSLMRMLGPSANSTGGLNVLLVSETPTYDPPGKTLSFPADSARVLNIGSSAAAVVLYDAEELPMDSADPVVLDRAVTSQHRGSDERFLSTVPASMRSLANSFIAAVRVQVVGELVLREPSGRFVETPNNFWTVKVQPRVQNFRITLRGKPGSFSPPSTFHLKDDRPGYSNFVLSDAQQIADAVQAIREASTH